MPVKDLTGPPRPSAEERALTKELLDRARRMIRDRDFIRERNRRRDDDDGLEPVPAPRGPSPSPLAGAAEATDDG